MKEPYRAINFAGIFKNKDNDNNNNDSNNNNNNNTDDNKNKEDSNKDIELKEIFIRYNIYVTVQANPGPTYDTIKMRREIKSLLK